MSDPLRAMRGTPLARDADEVATVLAVPSWPDFVTRRAWTVATSPPVRSSQDTTALPSFSSTRSTRPPGCPPSTRIGDPNVAPPSAEKATLTRFVSRAPLNQAMATLLPDALMDGPFTGHALILQLSLCTAAPSVHFPFTRRVT